VGPYSRQQERKQRTSDTSRDDGPASGPRASPESFAEFMREFSRDPWAWMEREVRRQQEQQRRQQRGQGGESQGRDQRFYDAGDAYYEAQRRQQQRQQQQWQQDRWQRRGAGPGQGPEVGGRPAGPDPLGLYARLGVQPGCSKEELSEAFRGMALKMHPDRYQGDAEKAAATKRFQVSTRRACLQPDQTLAQPLSTLLCTPPIALPLASMTPLQVQPLSYRPQPQALTEAYQVLRDPARRRQYDSTGRA
jgi:hypothetical protein